MNLLERGAAALVRRQQQAAGPSGQVLYRRYAGTELASEIDLTGQVWWGRTGFRRVGGSKRGGPSVVFASRSDRDYFVPAESLEGLDPPEPVRGDRIAEVADAGETVFEVMVLPDEPEFRASDLGRTILRVHVKEVTG